MKKKWVIVIDGPSGAGKSTISRLLAKKLGYLYLDTGALYRCVGLEADRKKIKSTDSRKLYQLVKRCKFSFKTKNLTQRVFLNGKDVTREIRKPKVSLLASQYASLSIVRRALLYVQRRFGKIGGIVAEGRDLGSVVFPKAELKFFMVATLKERAKRRYLELKPKFKGLRLVDVEREVRMRDLADSRRELAPLKRVKDAISLDTTSLTIDQVVEEMYKFFKKKHENSSQ